MYQYIQSLFRLMLALAFASNVVLSVPAFAQSESIQVADANGSTEPTMEDRLRKQEQQIEALQEQVRQLQAAGASDVAQPESENSQAGEGAPTVAVGASQKLGQVRETTEILSGDELVSAEFPASFPMFGTDMRMKIGGYLKTDFVFDLDGTLDKNQFLMSTIPVEGTPEYGNDGYFAAFAKESRINLDVRRIKPGSPALRAFVEGDFFSEGNQFRLRHAYMTVGNFLAGQTWTTLSFLESLPFMIDFAAGDALFGGRSTQIRYTRSVNERWKISIALEGLDLLGIENPSNLPGQANTQLPLAAIRADYRWGTGVLFLGSSIAELRWDGGTSGPDDKAIQYDFVFAGRQALNDANYVTWNVSYGVGSGENIIAFAGSGANAVLEADGSLKTMPAFSALVGYGHEWNSDWSSNVSLAYGWLDTPASRDPLSLKRGGIGHVNLIWKPAHAFSTGVEYMWGTQRVQNDALGSAGRIQFMAKFDF